MNTLKTVIQMLAALPNPTMVEADKFFRLIGLTVTGRDTVDDLVTSYNRVGGALKAQKEANDQQQKVIQKQQSQLTLKDNEIRRLQDIVQNTGVGSVTALRTQLEHKDAALARGKEKIKKLGNEIFNLNQLASKKNQYKGQILHLEREIELHKNTIEDLKADNETFIKANDILRNELLTADETQGKLKFPENHNSVHPYLKDFIRVGDIVKFKDGSCAADLMHDSFKLGHNFLGLNKDEWMVVAVNVACPTHTDGLASEVLSGMNNCIVKNLKGDVAFVSKLNIYVVRSWDDSKKIYDKYEKYF